MSKTLTAKQRIYLRDKVDFIPETAEKILINCYSQTCSPRQSIRGKCLQCKDFDREDIINCQDEICPLWNFRPFIDHGE